MQLVFTHLKSLVVLEISAEEKPASRIEHGVSNSYPNGENSKTLTWRGCLRKSVGSELGSSEWPSSPDQQSCLQVNLSSDVKCEPFPPGPD